MKNWLRISFVALLSVALLYYLEPIMANANEKYTEGIYTYSIFDQQVTIIDCDDSVAGAITIPSALGGYPVTAIGEKAFFECEQLTSVTFGNSLISIGDYAFWNCVNLTNIYASDSICYVASGAFFNTAWYNKQPDGLLYVG